MIDLSHLGGSGPGGDPKTHTPDIWGYVCLKYGLRSVIDIGCAMGFNACWFLDRGYDVEGVEGFPSYLRDNLLPKERLHCHDYAMGPFVPYREFDLGLCTEFVEHVEREFVGNFITTFRWCRYVLMTHALPGQGGYHHVNEQDSAYWIAAMDHARFDHLALETELLRSTYLSRENYGRNTLMLFRRR